MTRKTVTVGVCLLTLLLSSMNALAYNRQKAVDYALDWSEDTGDMNDGIAFTPAKDSEGVYKQFPLDCANFVSQCLIAGGIRFRSSTRSDDNTRNPLFGSDCPELETGYGTVAIDSDSPYSNDTKKYSRTITAADHLPRSLKHSRHGGSPNRTVEYGPPNLQDSGSMWNDVRPGDAFFLWNGASYSHCMFVSGVDTTAPKDLKYCAHTSWRRDHSLSSTVPYWKTNDTVRVVCLPDAPLLWNWTVRSGGNPVTIKWASSWPGSFPARNPALKADLVVRFTFDADMKTNELPDVQLVYISDMIRFEAWTDPLINSKGWYTGPDSGNSFKRNRTWKGRIPADQLPDHYHDGARIRICAKAADGTQTGRLNELSKYDPGYNGMIYIMLDTRHSGSSL